MFTVIKAEIYGNSNAMGKPFCVNKIPSSSFGVFQTGKRRNFDLEDSEIVPFILRMQFSSSICVTHSGVEFR